MARPNKRENFDVTPSQEAEIDCFKELVKAPSRKEALLSAVRIALHITSELQNGRKIYTGDSQGNDLRRLVMLGIEEPEYWPWKYLVQVPHPWKKQLYVKGRKLPAAAVWTATLTNKLSKAEAAENWDLPLEAIDEIFYYCEKNKALLQMEAEEEARQLSLKGIQV